MSHKKKNVYVFLFDGYSDWEISYVTPEINKSDKHELFYFSEHGDFVSSMGGLRIKPATSLDQLESAEIDLLILPGGTAWERGEIEGMEGITKDLFETGKPIASICAATTYLGQLGLLNDLKHTSNDLNYLKTTAPKYSGDRHYQDSLAVTDENIITANGIAPIEFSREIFKAIELYHDDHIEKWFQLFKNGIWPDT